MPDKPSLVQVAQADNKAQGNVKPNADPTPSPPPFINLKATRSAAEDIVDLPGIRDLPFKSLWLTGIELLLLLALYIAIRSTVLRVLKGTTEAVAAREESIGQMGRASRLRTLSDLIRGIILWTLGFVFGVTGLKAVGFDTTGILGTASVAGLAVGFGAQKLTKDIITGFFILFEDQYIVGDYVTIGAVTGTVEELGIRITRIRDDDGKLYILSNGDIVQVCNHSRGPVAGSFEIAIAASADPHKAAGVLTQALASFGESLSLPEAPRVEGVTQVDAAKTTLKITFRAQENNRPAVITPQLREAARQALTANNIPLG